MYSCKHDCSVYASYSTVTIANNLEVWIRSFALGNGSNGTYTVWEYKIDFDDIQPNLQQHLCQHTLIVFLSQHTTIATIYTL